MKATTNDKRIDDRAALLGAHVVASILGCSTRHVRRLVASGAMPRPIRLGSLVRWSRAELEMWIAEGCPVPEEAR